MQFGIDQLSTGSAFCRRLRAQRVGVLCHAASVDNALTHIVARLGALGIAPVLLFGPEHGLDASAQDMVAVADGGAVGEAPRVISLYGEQPEALRPRPSDLGEIDVLLVDLADVGSRYYTFVWTALLAARAAIDAGVHVVLLDRPNPLGGDGAQVEGRSQQPGFTSFVGLEPVPIRHGLTLAELVLLHLGPAEHQLGPDGAASAIAVRGWSRRSLAPDWDRPFVMPSPNMPGFDTALVYPGGCLLEGTNLSEGRGHTRPFEVVGAPWLDGPRLAATLAELELPGLVPRPLSFVPTFHKHAGELCRGVQIHVTDAATFRPVATYAALLAAARAQDPARFRFRTERYELVDDIPALDLLTGSAEARQQLSAGVAPGELAAWLSTPDPGWSERMAEAARRLLAAAW